MEPGAPPPLARISIESWRGSLSVRQSYEVPTVEDPCLATAGKERGWGRIVISNEGEKSEAGADLQIRAWLQQAKRRWGWLILYSLFLSAGGTAATVCDASGVKVFSKYYILRNTPEGS